ncbi:MAG: putative ferric reductase [Arenicella sp.]
MAGNIGSGICGCPCGQFHARDGWFWALGNATGLVAFAQLLILASNGRSGLGRTIRHRWLGLSVTLVVILHSLWFLLGDPITLEYLKWGAPHYMVAGLFSAALLLLVTVSSLASVSNRSYSTYKSFHIWHRWLSVLIILTALIHIVFSGLYITDQWQWAILLTASLAVYFPPKLVAFDYSSQRRNLVIATIVAIILFGILRTGATL